MTKLELFTWVCLLISTKLGKRERKGDGEGERKRDEKPEGERGMGEKRGRGKETHRPKVCRGRTAIG